MAEPGGNGILSGLKRILFKDEGGAQNQGYNIPPVPPPVEPAPSIDSPGASLNLQEQLGGQKDSNSRKLKVYQLLESLNRPAIDFFEVWNAATEMGGINPGNIKAAFTSLRIADKNLSKEKLIESGNFYISTLKNVLDKETAQRNQEIDQLKQQQQNLKAKLTQDISALEKSIADMQKSLEEKRQQQANIDQDFQPRYTQIKDKIIMGSQSVNEVLTEMNSVIQIINNNL